MDDSDDHNDQNVGIDTLGNNGHLFYGKNSHFSSLGNSLSPNNYQNHRHNKHQNDVSNHVNQREAHSLSPEAIPEQQKLN